MFVAFAAKVARAVGLLAGRADRRLGVEGCLDTVWLPLNHPNSKGLVNVLAVFIGAIVVECKANECRCPRLSGVRVANSAHISSLVIPLALFANS